MDKWIAALKAVRIIESCKTIEHYVVANQYIRQLERLFSKDKSYFDGELFAIYSLYETLGKRYETIKEK